MKKLSFILSLCAIVVVLLGGYVNALTLDYVGSSILYSNGVTNIKVATANSTNFIYLLTQAGYYYYGLASVTSAAETLAAAGSNLNPTYPGLYNLAAHQGKIATADATGPQGIVYGVNNVYGNLYAYTTQGIPPENAFIFGLANEAMIYMDYPYNLVQLYYGQKRASTTVVPVTPTDMTCDSKGARCFVAGGGSLVAYSLATNAAPSQLFVKTLDSKVRKNGIINSNKQYVYYLINDATYGIIVEALSYSGVNVFTKEIGLSYGTPIKMTFDSNQGTLFITTTSHILSLDWAGLNFVSKALVDSAVPIGINVMSASDTNDNDNYVVVTKAVGIFELYKYSSNCPQNCLNNGYCRYDVCTCPNGGDSGCAYSITGSSSTFQDDKITVTISGIFKTGLTSNDFTLKVGTTSVTTFTSTSATQIVFDFASYSATTEITITMSGQTLSYQPTEFYPTPTLDDTQFSQSITTLNLFGTKFASFYTFKVVITNQNALEIPITYVSDTKLKFDLSQIYTPRIEFDVYLNNAVLDSFAFSLAPLVDGVTPQSLSDKGTTGVSIQGNFFTQTPKVWLGEQVITTYDSTKSKAFIDLPAGFYTHLIFGNGFNNITVSLAYNSLSIVSAIQTEVQKLTISASEFGINQANVQVTLSGEQLTISGFDYQNGIINVTLTDDSDKGELVVIARETKSIMVNLKPNITSIEPINPSYDGETITITGLYLSTDVELTNNENVKSTLVCSSLTSTTISCPIPAGTGSFSLQSISAHPTENQPSSPSNTYQSTYKTKPTTSSQSTSQSTSQTTSETTSQTTSSQTTSETTSSQTTSSQTTSSQTTSETTSQTTSQSTSSQTTSSQTTSETTSQTTSQSTSSQTTSQTTSETSSQSTSSQTTSSQTTSETSSPSTSSPTTSSQTTSDPTSSTTGSGSSTPTSSTTPTTTPSNTSGDEVPEPNSAISLQTLSSYNLFILSSLLVILFY